MVIGHTLGFMTILTIFMMILAQYIAIVYPFTYRNYLKAKVLILSVIALTLLMLLIMVLTQFHFRQAMRLAHSLKAGLIIILLITMFILFAHMPIVLKRTRRQAMNCTDLNKRRQEQKDQKMHAKLARTALVVLFAFMTCYMPISIFNMALNKRISYLDLSLEISLSMIGMFNSLLDGLVYHIRHGRVRTSITRMFTEYFNRRINPSGGTPTASKTTRTQVMSSDQSKVQSQSRETTAVGVHTEVKV